MSLIFVSHADADKHRIKPVTDRLLQMGWRLFIDRPDEMAYTSEEIKTGIDNIRVGHNWFATINDALKRASCVILFASVNLLDKSRNRSALKREVAIGDFHGKLITVRIDEFDLRDLGQDFGLSQNQYLDLFLPHGDGPGLNRKIERLIEAIREKLEEARKSEKGPFQANFTPPSKAPPAMAAALIDLFLMMLDRESETSSFCFSASRLNILVAPASARSWYFKRRLAERELPRIAVPQPAGDAAEALIYENQWDQKRFNWFPDLGRSEEQDMRAALEQIVRAFPELPLPSRQMSDQECIGLLLKRLSADRKPVLLTAYVEDKAKLRGRNAYLIRSLANLLQAIPEERCRLLIRVEPAANSRPATATWLKKLAAETSIGGPITLGDIRKEDLFAWCDFMEQHVERTAQNIFDSVSELFGTNTALTFADLEAKVVPALQEWPLRPQYHRTSFPD
jgi:hypothetical protein